jgi:glycosyltransferase involved in cell wall biosynthesis
MMTAAEPRRRVLLVTVELRVPPVTGRERRYWQHVVALRPAADVGVLVLDRQGNSAPPPDGVAWWRRCSAPFVEEVAEWMRQPDGHPSYGRLSAEALAALDESLEAFDPDVVVVAGLWLHGHLDRLCGSDRHVILDAADVEAALHEDLARTAGRGERVVRAALARRVAQIEGQAARSVDQIWACSERDRDLIRARYGATASVAVVPNTVDVESLRPAHSAAPNAPTVVYPATFSYPPNEAAALSLITEVHPLLQRHSRLAKLNLVGIEPTAAMHEAAAQASGVTITGPVPDTRPWLWAATALAAPLRHGSGTRIKLLEAFAAGVPVVTTTKGAEGLDVVDGEHVLIAHSPEEFADAIGELHTSPETSSALVTRARLLVGSRHSAASARRAVESALAQLPVRTP